ncbi:hypothetical protein WOLCODRAFT_162758 [Wolfiporia cocos MD-104 SS10]|uniref:Uncharacterized protein n=1 Tax=Wolfiporia cocos (strain MD-104) TaxID=742152 RepID=A0A2H3JHJ9_WOLCO|nr:hypothetical protein WOLCODRAFT_162758 [Wolfiporia cocos MD-104 SS10]
MASTSTSGSVPSPRTFAAGPSRLRRSTPATEHRQPNQSPATSASTGPSEGQGPPTAGNITPQGSGSSATLTNLTRFRSSGTLSSSATFTVSAPKIALRVDPALVTCFDPEDKELYDLWAPKR